MENSSKDNDSTENVARNQFEKHDINLARTLNENSTSHVIKLASENNCLHFSRSLEVSNQLSHQPPVLFSQAPNIDKLGENTDVDSSQEIGGRSSCSQNNYHVSLRPNPENFSVSVLENSGASEAKTTQNYMSPFPTSRKSDFISPPEPGTVSMIKSLSKNLKESNTPSPEKRGIGTDAVSSPIKKLRITPESDSSKHGSRTESCLSNLSFSSPTKISCTSPTNHQIQQTKVAIQNKEVSGSLYTLSIPSGGKIIITRNSSLGLDVANDQFSSNFVSPPSTNIVHGSPTNLQILRNKVADRDVGESPTEREALIDCSAESNSPAKHSKRGDLNQCASSRTSPKVENEHKISTESSDASSNNANIKTRKQKDAQLTSHIPNEDFLSSGISEKTDTTMHPTIFTDTPLFKRNVLLKQKDRRSISGVFCKYLLPDFPEKEIEPVVYPHRLTETNFCSNDGTESKPQNDTSEEFESDIEVRKICNFASVLVKETKATVADLAIETPILKSSYSGPLVLNPYSSLSLHLPRGNNSSATYVHSCVLEFDTSYEEDEIDQNLSDSSIQPPSPHSQSISQSSELSELRSPGMHRDSLSDEILTPSSSSDNLIIYNCMRDVLQGMFSRSNSEESTAFSSFGMHRRSASDGTLTSINLTEFKTQQDQSNSSIKSHSKESPLSRSLPEISKVINRETCVGKPLSRGNLSRPTSCSSSPANNPHSDSSYRVMSEVTENLSSSESSTSRNNPEVQMQRSRNDPLQQKSYEGSLTGKTFASRNPFEVVRGVNLPSVDIIEFQPSASSQQPVLGNLSFAFDQASTSRNQPEMASRVNPSYIPAVEGLASTSMGNIVNGSSLDPLDASPGHPPTSDSPHTENAGEKVRDTFDEHSEYVVEARHLLLWVLKEMMQLNGEGHLWTLFEPTFCRVSESRTDLERMQLHSALAWYLAKRGYSLWNQILFKTYEMSGETFILSINEKLISVVAGTISLTLGAPTIYSNSIAFLSYYENLKNLCFDLTAYSRTYSLEDIQDEASRNRIKILKKKINNLVLRTLSAFRLLLMYLGENSEQESIERFELQVRDEEDRTFLRSLNRF